MSKNRPSRQSAVKLVAEFLVGDVDAVPLRIFEICFACSFMVWVAYGFCHWREWLTAEGFHFNAYELRAMGSRPPMPLLSGGGVLVFAVLVLAAGAALAMNVGRRFALVLLFASALYIQSADMATAAMANKLFVGVFFCLVVSPGCFRCRTTGKLLVSAVALRSAQATLILMYFTSGFAKAFHGDWLKHSDVVFTHAQGVYRTDFAAWMLRIMPLSAWTVMQWVTLAFELSAPLLFTIRRLQPLAIGMGMGFHLMIALIMKDLYLYALPMWSFYVLFITSDEWRSIGAWLRQWTLNTPLR